MTNRREEEENLKTRKKKKRKKKKLQHTCFSYHKSSHRDTIFPFPCAAPTFTCTKVDYMAQLFDFNLNTDSIHKVTTTKRHVHTANHLPFGRLTAYPPLVRLENTSTFAFHS